LFSTPVADPRYNAYKTLPPGFNPTKMFMDTLQSTYQVTWTWEARELGMEFALPIFIFQGEQDINTPASLAKKYLQEIKAPIKVYASIPGAGHNTIVFNTELLQLLNEHVLTAVER
jgi:pimeloyl-ACP methyl ester carboxylesterase